MLNIYLARYGQNQDNANGILNGHRDLPLTELGIAQAEEVAIKIKADMTSSTNVHGAISYSDMPGQNDFLFRVSLKAVILNDGGHVLVVKEKGRDWWDIPGGGLEHGETIKKHLLVNYSKRFHLKVILTMKLFLAKTRAIKKATTCTK